MSYQALARQWRPRSFQEIVGQEPTVRMLTYALDHQRLHHAYLFTGTRGVGKTTFARVFAKSLSCDSGITSKPCGICNPCTSIDNGSYLDLIEVDAASRTKVEDTRELLQNIHYPPAEGRYKIYLIDEVHMLSGHSFNALLKTLEEPPPYVIFLLATTDPKRLPITVLSRCLQFSLKQLSVVDITKQLQTICAAENVTYELPALTHLATTADGSMRDGLSLLDQAIAFGAGRITLLDTEKMLGSVAHDALFRLLQALLDQDGLTLLSEITQWSEWAVDFSQALNDLATLLHQINVAQVINGTVFHEKIHHFARSFKMEDIQLYYQIAVIGRRDLPLAPNPLLGFEMTLLRMLAFRPDTNTDPDPVKNHPIKEKETNQLKGAIPPKEMGGEKNPINATKPPLKTWSAILAELDLSGMARALADNCSLVTLRNDQHQTILALPKQHQSLLNPKYAERIEAALSRYLNHPTKLMITLSDVSMDTPSKQRAQQTDIKQQTANESIKNDDDIQNIMRLLDATLDVGSIKPV